MRPKPQVESIRQRGNEELLFGIGKLMEQRNDTPAPNNRRTKLFVLCTVAVLAAGVLVAVWYGRPHQPAAGDALIDPVASSGAAPHGATNRDATVLEDGIKISGFFTAHDVVQISATVLARVKRILVHEGMTVQKGDLMVELSNANGDHDVQAQEESLSGAQLQIRKTLLVMQNAELELERQNSLMEKGFGTRKALQDAGLGLAQAKLDLATSRSAEQNVSAKLKALRQNRLEYMIRAPFSGVVIAQNARVGEVVSPSNGGSYIRSGLLSLVDPTTLEVEVSVQERLLPQIKDAACALVTSLAEGTEVRNVPFRLGRVNSVADRQRGAVNAILVPIKQLPRLPILDTSAEVRFVKSGSPECGQNVPAL